MADMAGNIWTHERVERLKQLWAEGLSASQVAAGIGGVTRNSVLGKVHRLGLAERQADGRAAPRPNKIPLQPPTEDAPIEPVRLQSRRVPVVAPPAKVEQAPPAPHAEVAIPRSERVTIVDLRDGLCRWPLGDPTTAEFRFCGARVSENLPYCTPHAALAYVPAERRRPQPLAARA